MNATSQFSGLRPFPGEESDRLGLGGNNPPLEERIIMDFDANLREHDGLIERIEAMVAKAEAAGPCLNDDDAGRYGDFIKMTGAVVKVIDGEYEILNRPMINARSALKARADHYLGMASAAGAKVREKLDTYLAAKETERRAEAARQAEIERQAALERQRVIDAANAEAARVAEVERQRLQAIADAEAETERVKKQAEEDARAAAEQREAKLVEVESEVVEVEPEPVFIADPEPVFNPLGVGKAPIRGNYGTAVSTVETWNVKVENIRQVPDQFLKHPTVLEALEKVIRPLVRGKNGLREIKGCIITSSLSSSVR
jgi:flagellar biosynthesis GTPase FlhF